jgi:hypothetical protein
LERRNGNDPGVSIIRNCATGPFGHFRKKKERCKPFHFCRQRDKLPLFNTKKIRVTHDEALLILKSCGNDDKRKISVFVVVEVLLQFFLH